MARMVRPYVVDTALKIGEICLLLDPFSENIIKYIYDGNRVCVSIKDNGICIHIRKNGSVTVRSYLVLNDSIPVVGVVKPVPDPDNDVVNDIADLLRRSRVLGCKTYRVEKSS